jgi:hypothetical protein
MNAATVTEKESGKKSLRTENTFAVNAMAPAQGATNEKERRMNLDTWNYLCGVIFNLLVLVLIWLKTDEEVTPWNALPIVAVSGISWWVLLIIPCGITAILVLWILYQLHRVLTPWHGTLRAIDRFMSTPIRRHRTTKD